jgi:cobyrinic acid a,c-diamide synthase
VRPLLIAAAGSGSGKTTLTAGILRALSRRGVPVVPAKCGPDFLDPAWLAAAARKPCLNLDPWMMGEEWVRNQARRCRERGLLVVEGVMGLYDGAAPESDEGSSAHVARLLDAQVLLVLDAGGCARTFAALVHGLTDFGKIPVCGVVANRTGSDGHAKLLARALESASLPPLLGHVPKGEVPELSSRHLGLVAPGDDAVLERLADIVEARLDLSAWSNALSTPDPLPDGVPDGPVLAVARDEALGFLYQDALDALRDQGVRIAWTSPLHDDDLPRGAQGLWIPGGYPEEHAGALARNRAWMGAVREFCASGRPVLAECGGMMLLCETLTDRHGATHAMAGVIPARVKMNSRLAALGYTEVRLVASSFLGEPGDLLRGHEFHYGSLIDAPALPLAFEPTRSGGRSEGIGYRKDGLVASWVHLHLASRPLSIQAWASALQASAPWEGVG